MKTIWAALSRQRLAEVSLVLLLALAYLYTFPRWADPSQNSRLDMIVAAVEDHTFQIDRYVSNTVDYARVGDHYYSDKAPGVAFLGIPIYAGLKQVLDLPWVDQLTGRLESSPAFAATLNPEGTGVLTSKVRFAAGQVVLSFCLSVLPTLWIAVLISRLLNRWGASPALSAGLPLVYGLLTPVFAYANSLYSHQLSAALCVAVYCWAAASPEPLTRRGFALAGLALGWAVISEYPAALCAVAAGLLAIWQAGWGRRLLALLWLALGALPPLLAWMGYNTFIFGSPLSLGYGYSELWTTQHHTGFMSLTFPRLDALWGVTFSPYRGLFLLSPVLLLGMGGFVAWWCSRLRRPALLAALGALVATLLFNISSIMWWGGFAVGPRYLLPALPFLVLPMIFLFPRISSRSAWKPLVALLGLWSLVATWGLTLAGQAFPSDTLFYPLVEYAWPAWLSGDLARNLGTLLDLHGPLSLLPLAMGGAVIASIWWVVDRSLRSQSQPGLEPLPVGDLRT